MAVCLGSGKQVTGRNRGGPACLPANNRASYHLLLEPASDSPKPCSCGIVSHLISAHLPWRCCRRSDIESFERLQMTKSTNRLNLVRTFGCRVAAPTMRAWYAGEQAGPARKPDQPKCNFQSYVRDGMTAILAPTSAQTTERSHSAGSSLD